jgi:hypothetical protein
MLESDHQTRGSILIKGQGIAGSSPAIAAQLILRTGRADNCRLGSYISPARHVRAFGVGIGKIENDGNEKIERRP